MASQPKPFRDARLDAGKARTIARGEPLYSLGDPLGGIFGIAEGFADVLVASGFMPPVLGHIARPGWWVGESAAITKSPRGAEIRARTDLLVCYVSLRNLDKLEAAFPNFGCAVAELMVLHLDNALMYAASLVKGDARMKIATALIRLAGPEAHRDAEISCPCSQHDLGELAGLSRNSAGPILRELERQGLLKRSIYGYVTFNPRHLAQMMEADLLRAT